MDKTDKTDFADLDKHIQDFKLKIEQNAWTLIYAKTQVAELDDIILALQAIRDNLKRFL